MSTARPNDSASNSDQALAAAFSGPNAAENIAAVKRGLNAALDDWWLRGTLPSALLLRDGLLTLEAGHPLDDAQTSLLLRAAVAYRRGVLTALRHQDDPERTAVILADALLAEDAPLTIADVASLRSQDIDSDEWAAALRDVLQEEASSADAARRARALAVLGATEGEEWSLMAEAVNEAALAPDQRPRATPWLRLTWVKAVLILVPLLALVTGAIWLQQRARTEGLVRVSAGVYTVSDVAVGGGDKQVSLPAFAIDRTEVTNVAYRRCVERSACPAPATNSSALRPQYWLDPTFDQYPVVNVEKDAAAKFCAFVGERLPTAAEWEIAAGYAPGTERRYRYPWGNEFQSQRANGQSAGIGDTQTIGSYRPIGDSPLGASDMAGNVAEWTSTVGEGTGAAGTAPAFVVKGGSFNDDDKALAVEAWQVVKSTTTAPWLGFRCAVDVAGG